MINKPLGLNFAALILVFPQNRNKSLRKGTFCKQAAQQIRQLERDEKGIGKHPRTEYPRYHEIADEAENAREQCHTADGGKCFKQIHL